MKRCIFVWQVPVIEGEYYNPIKYAIYVRKAKKFVCVLNEYFEKENMNWKCVLDNSACIFGEIFSSQNQVVIFSPEAKTRHWLYKKNMQDEYGKIYYLDYVEYYSRKIDKIVEFIKKTEKRNEDEINGIIE